MQKIFPSMNSKPEKVRIFSLVMCYLWVFVLVPMFMPFLGAGLWENRELIAWLEIAYHVANGVILLIIIGSYLKEEWFMVTTDACFYLKHIALTVGLMVGTELVFMGTLYLFGIRIDYILESLPVVEMLISHTPLALLADKPLFGTIALSVFSPISICTLFYCFVFAPLCYKRPWLAYLGIALITMVPPAVDMLWRGEIMLDLCIYLAQLPIHLLACWSYQKTDNVWTPLLSLAATNLLLSVIQLLLLR